MKPMSIENIVNKNMSSNNTNITLCTSINEIPTFVYQSSFVLKRPEPNFVYKSDSLAKCVDICRKNIEPLEGEIFICYGFTYANKNGENFCEFFDDTSMASLSSY